MKPEPRRAEIVEVVEGRTYRDDWGHERREANHCIVRDETGQRHTIYHSQSVGGIDHRARRLGVKGTVAYTKLGSASLWVFTPQRDAPGGRT